MEFEFTTCWHSHGYELQNEISFQKRCNLISINADIQRLKVSSSAIYLALWVKTVQNYTGSIVLSLKRWEMISTMQIIMLINTCFLVSLSFFTLPLFSLCVQMSGSYRPNFLDPKVDATAARMQSMKVSDAISMRISSWQQETVYVLYKTSLKLNLFILLGQQERHWLFKTILAVYKEL